LLYKTYTLLTGKSNLKKPENSGFLKDFKLKTLTAIWDCVIIYHKQAMVSSEDIVTRQQG